MAINGNGYFIVKKPDNFAGGQPVFGGVNLYTRRGDFQSDKNGFLVNQAGYYLMGLPVDPTTGNPVGSVPIVLQFTNNLIPAQATTQIQYNANLPSNPITTSTQPGVPVSSLLDPLAFTSNPIVTGAAAALLAGAVGTFPKTSPGRQRCDSLRQSGGQIDNGDGWRQSANDNHLRSHPNFDSLAELANGAARASPASMRACTTVVQNGGAANGQITITAANTTDVITSLKAPRRARDAWPYESNRHCPTIKPCSVSTRPLSSTSRSPVVRSRPTTALARR